MTSGTSKSAKESDRQARDERRAAALRENLRRRKSQARARQDSGAGTRGRPGADKASATKTEP